MNLKALKEAAERAQAIAAKPMDEQPHQDWCRWWEHGDLCACGVADVPLDPATVLSLIEAVERAERALLDASVALRIGHNSLVAVETVRDALADIRKLKGEQ